MRLRQLPATLVQGRLVHLWHTLDDHYFTTLRTSAGSGRRSSALLLPLTRLPLVRAVAYQRRIQRPLLCTGQLHYAAANTASEPGAKSDPITVCPDASNTGDTLAPARTTAPTAPATPCGLDRPDTRATLSS